MNLELIWNVGWPLRRLRWRHPEFFDRQPPAGWMRGVDFYSREEFGAALEQAACHFKGRMGFWPRFDKPKRYSEKIFWQKFFGLLPVPVAGNKLLTAKHIPKSLAGEIDTAPLRYRSKQAVLPNNDELPAGNYILKANHGAGMYLSLAYPLDSDTRAAAQAKCREWLADDYGHRNGEWWYSAFEREILIEDRLGSGDELLDWRFHILDGKLAFISVTCVKNGRIVEGVLLDDEFRPCAEQSKSSRPLLAVSLPRRLGDAKRISEEIGRHYPFLRVDLYILDEKIYLGEITIAPASGMLSYSAEFDFALGKNLASLPDFRFTFHERVADLNLA